MNFDNTSLCNITHEMRRTDKGDQGDNLTEQFNWIVPNISCSWQYGNSDRSHCHRALIGIVLFLSPWFDFCFQYSLLLNLLEKSLRIFKSLSLFPGTSTHLFYISTLICSYLVIGLIFPKFKIIISCPLCCHHRKDHFIHNFGSLLVGFVKFRTTWTLWFLNLVKPFEL